MSVSPDRAARRLGALAVLLALVSACGARTPLDVSPASDAGPTGAPERCDGLDDDGDGRVDESFRDGAGRYVDDAHCGACGRACSTPIDHATSVGCELLADAPACVARECAEGYGPSAGGGCAALDAYVCLSCVNDSDCGPLLDARCVDVDGEPRCSRSCVPSCPSGYVCLEGEHCIPAAGSCRCPSEGPAFTLACSVSDACVGVAECREGAQSTCAPPEERCGGEDDDCDGTLDEGFRDARGAYSLDPRHCGACGQDCTRDAESGAPLACGGDPFAPSCVTACPDAEDGVQVGDVLDADRRLDNGCECVVVSTRDVLGGASGALDENCDGADGSVLESFYVASGGDDAGPGSPTRPLASIDEAVQRAHASLATGAPRPDVYVAAGIYAETVHLLDGVRVHGGYRGDFLARDPGGYEVIVAAPSDGDAPGHAALVADAVGARLTLIEGIELRGGDAQRPGELAIGAALLVPGPNLVLRDLRVRSGRPSAGAAGEDGVAGTAPSAEATAGEPPRAASETADHVCIAGEDNLTRGGAGGQNTCGGVVVHGGAGGSAMCPAFGAFSASGQPGLGRGDAAGGAGGGGGRDLSGPILQSEACGQAVCCGLADFTVPSPFALPQPGAAGSDGVLGSAGGACTDPRGSFGVDAAFMPASQALPGTAGGPGGGGGGGGSGGGAAMQWIAGACEHPDGLGGAGGGGGAGGCGGAGGNAGGAGGAAIGILVRVGAQGTQPDIEDCEIIVLDGGAGGDGGNGGDGGPGGLGGFGGRVPDDARTTPPLAGPIAGERGGPGGDGGAGGGGGGGCGGMAVGIWLTGPGIPPGQIADYVNANAFTIGAGGDGGRGGGGALPASAGRDGEAHEVLAW